MLSDINVRKNHLLILIRLPVLVTQFTQHSPLPLEKLLVRHVIFGLFLNVSGKANFADPVAVVCVRTENTFGLQQLVIAAKGTTIEFW
mmetsp:Transcript_4964/g.14645  ORF Transcript_4964/g.14645 Transcript_4964/m.14645 type:complete len:88 (+) Transcript_4964:935-1198(+)